MELNAEINRVVGEQMAVLLADKISEEEMEQAARACWNVITKRPYSYGREEESQLDKLIKKHIIEKVLEEIDNILSEPQPKEAIHAEAALIVKEARERAHLVLVNTISENICRITLLRDHAEENIHIGASIIADAIRNR